MKIVTLLCCSMYLIRSPQSDSVALLLDQTVQSIPFYNLFNPKLNKNTSFHQTSSVPMRGNTTAKVDDVSICIG